MKTLMISAVALSIAVPAFADDGLEGRILLPGEANAVSVTEQLAGSTDMMGFDAVSVIRANAAESDASLVAYQVRTAPETVSTQSFGGTVSGQFVGTLGEDAVGMNLSDAAAAYLNEVSDD